MVQIINSVFDELDGLTVEEALSNPTYLPERVRESLQGVQWHELLFRKTTAGSNVVAYRDRTVAELESEPEPVAEFGEIPVADPIAPDDYKIAPVIKRAKGIRVSWEQIVDNDMAAVRRELEGRATSVLKGKINESTAALRAAEVPELAVSVSWNQQGANPAEDVLDAIEMVQGAEDETGASYDFDPDLIIIHPRTLTMLKRNDEVKKLYIGDMAHAHPLFAGLAREQVLFGQLRVIKNNQVPKGEIFIATEGQAGFMAEREPEEFTDFYDERGQSSRHGATMSQRSDYVHRRGWGVDGSKSIVRITGAVS
nr:MAG TPA: capsid protein [Caudoviricetes sp.]